MHGKKILAIADPALACAEKLARQYAAELAADRACIEAAPGGKEKQRLERACKRERARLNALERQLVATEATTIAGVVAKLDSIAVAIRDGASSFMPRANCQILRAIDCLRAQDLAQALQLLEPAGDAARARAHARKEPLYLDEMLLTSAFLDMQHLANAAAPRRVA